MSTLDETATTVSPDEYIYMYIYTEIPRPAFIRPFLSEFACAYLNVLLYYVVKCLEYN